MDTQVLRPGKETEAFDNYQKLAMVLDKRPNRRRAGKSRTRTGTISQAVSDKFTPDFIHIEERVI